MFNTIFVGKYCFLILFYYLMVLFVLSYRLSGLQELNTVDCVNSAMKTWTTTAFSSWSAWPKRTMPSSAGSSSVVWFPWHYSWCTVPCTFLEPTLIWLTATPFTPCFGQTVGCWVWSPWTPPPYCGVWTSWGSSSRWCPGEWPRCSWVEPKRPWLNRRDSSTFYTSWWEGSLLLRIR